MERIQTTHVEALVRRGGRGGDDREHGGTEAREARGCVGRVRETSQGDGRIRGGVVVDTPGQQLAEKGCGGG